MIVEAKMPFNITDVSDDWCAFTEFTRSDIMLGRDTGTNRGRIDVLKCEETNQQHFGWLLDEGIKKNVASQSILWNRKKSGEMFYNYMLAYPLSSTSSDIR